MSPAALAVGKPCETLFSTSSTSNVSTEIILSNVPPPCAFINGLYKQTGMLPRAWSATRRYNGPAGHHTGGEDRLPVFRHAGVMGANGRFLDATPPPLTGPPVMYYDGGREAWVVARRLGSTDVLAKSSGRADHPAVSSAAWSVRNDAGAFHVDIDVDVVGTEVGEPLATAFVDINPAAIPSSPPPAASSDTAATSAAPADGEAAALARASVPLQQAYVQPFKASELQRYGGGGQTVLAPSGDGGVHDHSPTRPATLRDVDGVLASPSGPHSAHVISPGRAHPPPPALNLSLFDSPVSPPSPEANAKLHRNISASDSLFNDTFGDDTWGQPPEMSPSVATTPSDVHMMTKLQALPSFTAPLSSARVAFIRDSTGTDLAMSAPPRGVVPKALPVFGSGKYTTYGGGAEQTSPADDSGEFTPPLSDVEGTLED